MLGLLLAPVLYITPAAYHQVIDNPPECVLVKVAASDGSSRVWLNMCGTGAAGESPLLDQLAGELPLIVDGAGLRGINCGWRANPCVIFWPQSPAESPKLREF